MAHTTLTYAWKQRRAEARIYRPQRIRLLLISSAPTDEDHHFYSPAPPQEDALFSAVGEVPFETAPRGTDRAPWLKQLRRRGVFLVEAKPNGPLTPTERLDKFVPWLVLTCQEIEPEHIILLHAAVYDAAYAALRAANLPVVKERIPEPVRGRATEFRRRLRAAIVRVGLERIIRPLAPAPRRPTRAGTSAAGEHARA